jgi:hypothetical protein
LYRTERGQAAFNETMATLLATDGSPPSAKAFRNCPDLECNPTLPAIGRDGWLPAGRLWISPSEYLLIAHSPRSTEERPDRRRMHQTLKYFVLHEFHNSSGNTDPYDTISSHRGRVFVPLYMSKQQTDAKGRRFVAVVQVAPYDVASIHASNMDSAGPGMEVAKNSSDELERLQGLAGVVIATMVKSAAPQLRVVHHRGQEGLAMLDIYQRWVERLHAKNRSTMSVLPFVPLSSARLALASGSIDDVIARRGVVPRPQLATREKPDIALPARLAVYTLVEPIRVAPRPVCGATGAVTLVSCRSPMSVKQ